MVAYKQASVGLMAIMLTCSLTAGVSQAKEITGKVVGVFHEKVTTPAPNPKTLDKVSATVISCANGQFETVHYPLGIVSETNSLGHMFRHLATAARTTSTKNQYMNSVGGHATFETNDTNQVIKTTFWGHNWECGRNLDAPAGASASSAPAGNSAAATATPQAQTAQPSSAGKAAKVMGGLGRVGRFGF